MVGARKSDRGPRAGKDGRHGQQGGSEARGAGDEPGRSNPLGLEVDAEVLEFIDAIDRFKKEHNRPFPSWSEVLHVLRGLGYRRG